MLAIGVILTIGVAAFGFLWFSDINPLNRQSHPENRNELASASVNTMAETSDIKTGEKKESEDEPKTDPAVEPKTEPKVELKIEPKVEPKTEPKVEPKAEPKLIPPPPESKKPAPEIPDDVPSLIKQLKDIDAATRLVAAKRLEKLGEIAKDAIPALTEALKDPDEDVRTVAQRAIIAINTGSMKEEVATLIKQLKDKDEIVRLQAAKRLGQLASDAGEAIPALTEALKDTDADVRNVAKKSIESIQVAAKGGNPLLVDILSGLKSKQPAERIKAAKELAQLGEVGREATKPLLESMMELYPTNREDFFDALERINPKLHKPVLTLCIDQDISNRYSALADIGLLGTKAQDALPVLVGHYRTLASGKAITAIDRRNHDLAVHCLIVCSRVSPEDIQIRQTVIGFLSAPPFSFYVYEADRYGFYEKLGLQELEQTLARGASPSKYLAINLATEMKIEGKQLVTPLVSCLGDPNFRLTAIEHLGRIGQDAKAAVPALNKLRFDSNQAVREASIAALKLIQGG